MRTWPALLCWPSGPSGATLEGHLTCLALQARGPSWCPDRLRGVWLSMSLMTHLTTLWGLLCSVGPLAQLSPKVPKHRHSLTKPFTHRLIYFSQALWCFQVLQVDGIFIKFQLRAWSNCLDICSCSLAYDRGLFVPIECQQLLMDV